MGRTSTRLLAALIATTAFTGSAFAADLPAPLPVMEAGDWTGFHIGFGGGFGGVNHRLALRAEDLIVNEDFGDVLDLSGIGGEGGLFTVEGGYDFQVSNGFLIGIQGDYTYSGIGTDLIIGGLGSYSLDAAQSATVMGRFGWISSPDTVIYGLVGWTWTEFEGKFSGGGLDYDFKLNGLTAGAGIETRFSSNVTGKLEYRYVDYKDNSLISGVIDDYFLDFYNDTSVQTIRAVVSYRMGNPGGYVTPTADFEPVEEVRTWSGFRIGGGIGYGQVNHELSVRAEACGPPGCQSETLGSLSGFTGEGFLWTGEVGYDHQFGESWVGGIQFDYTGSDIKTEAELDLDVPGFTGYRLKARNNYTVAGRLGYLANPDTLVYGLLGWTWTDFEQDILFLGEDVFTNDFKGNGLTLGGGIETNLTENVTGKLEYRYTNYKRINVFEYRQQIADLIFIDYELNNDPSLQSVRAVVSYKLPVFDSFTD